VNTKTLAQVNEMNNNQLDRTYHCCGTSKPLQKPTRTKFAENGAIAASPKPCVSLEQPHAGMNGRKRITPEDVCFIRQELANDSNPKQSRQEGPFGRVG
jgi:hypothetical protein